MGTLWAHIAPIARRMLFILSGLSYLNFVGDTELPKLRIPKPLMDELKRVSKLTKRSAANFAQTVLEQALDQVYESEKRGLLPIVAETLTAMGTPIEVSMIKRMEDLEKRVESLEERREKLEGNA